MTSQVNPNNIDGTYPVAGQDNDSQGFRDNFTNIRNNLTYVKAEIEDLQSKAVLKSALLNSTLDNNFVGNAIVNPSFTSWRETYNNIGAASGAVTINFTNGNFQKITMSGSTTLSFSWPSNTANQFVSIKLWVSNPSASYTLTLPTACTLGDPDTIAGLAGTSPPIITFTSAEIANNTEYLFEFFTVDGGTTIGIKDLIRNRDVDLSGMSITGNLSLDGLSVSTYPVTLTPNVTVVGNTFLGSSINDTVGSNVVVRSNVASTSATTGALVVVGGAGISANVNIDGNLFVNSGNIRSSGTTANIFNVTTQTISVGNAATNIFMGVSTGNVRVAGNIYTGSNLNVTGNTVTAGGRINTNYLLANVVTGQNLFANVNYNRFIANCSPTGTVANLFITLPNSVEDGRELEFTTMTAITSCFISNMTPGVTSVYGLANTWASTASLTSAITVKLMYNATVGRWFKVN